MEAAYEDPPPRASPVRPSRSHFRPAREGQRATMTVEKVYQSKKNAYRHYIREIYTRINQELRKKNSFLTVTHTNRIVDCSLSLTAKQLRPLRPDPVSLENKEKFVQMPKERSERMDRPDEGELRRKLAGEKVRLQKLQDDTISIQRIRQKLMAMRKDDEEERKEATMHKQQILLSKTQREMKFRETKTQMATDRLPKREFFKQKRRQRIYSLNNNAVSRPAEDYIMNRFLFGRKEPFVCGLGEKQGAQEKQRERVLAYLDFLWKANFACGLFVRSQPEEVCYRAYVGNGNNSLMLKALIKRRFWWALSDKPEGCHFIWTQLKVNSIFKAQQPSSTIRDPTVAIRIDINEDERDELHGRIFHSNDLQNWQQHLSRNSKNEVVINQRTYLKRAALLGSKTLQRIEDNSKVVVHNHLEQNYYIGNKKALFYNMRAYYSKMQMNVFDALPLTFHIVKGIEDPEYKLFFNYYSQLEENKRRGKDQRNVWIVKPGEYSNRGHGISVCHSLDDILLRLKGKEKSGDGSARTFILQKYLEKPLLYKSRKFDIRHYLLISCINGSIRAYWYPEGYIRTSSATYSLARNADLLTHLTNDAVQKHSDDYGKYQRGNKVNYQKFQAYLDKALRGPNQKGIFYSTILPQMRQLAINAVRGTYFLLDPRRRQHNFQLLGMDFMIDQSLKPWLIEINTNPCLQLSSPLLARLIPALVENTLRLCVDPFFPPPEGWPSGRKFALTQDALAENRFQLIFDEALQGPEVEKLFAGDLRAEAGMGKVQEDAQVYENEGAEQWEEGKREEP